MPRGLSPRVRGSPEADRVDPSRGGSIPACAGEPEIRATVWVSPRVYPRVCGGALIIDMGLTAGPGLSPRVRGEPVARPSPPCGHRVYPRVCGGGGHAPTADVHGAGLSPRVRGSQYALIWSRKATRSIPACAGEP